MIYVAAPYGHTSREVMDQRIEEVEKFLAYLVSNGRHAFSPLLMHHVLDKGYNLPSDFNFWGEFCLSLLRNCDLMIVLMLPSWDTSRGVLEEIEYCKKNSIPIEYHEIQSNSESSSRTT